MQVQAIAKYLRVSPRKARRVAATVKGRPAGEALAILRFLPSPTARTLAKVVRSAIANAENTYNLDPANLTVTSVLVDKGPVFKRNRSEIPRPMGACQKAHKPRNRNR